MFANGTIPTDDSIGQYKDGLLSIYTDNEDYHS